MLKFCKNCNVNTEWYSGNGCKPCALKRHSEWAKKNRDKVNANSRRWNAENEEKKRNTNALYREQNQEKINQSRRKTRLVNPDSERIKAAKRRAYKKQSIGQLSADIVSKLLVTQNGLCACCGVPLLGVYHLDHVVPLSKGGHNSDGNVQLLLPKCNLEKYNAMPEIFLQRRVKDCLQALPACGKL